MRSSSGPEILLRYLRIAALRGAAPFRIAEAAAAGARVHRGDEHELRGKSHRAGGAGNRHRAVLQRLAQDLQRAAAKFGQLVEKENAVMREAHFAGARIRRAADQARVGNRVVRRAEGPARDHRLFGREQAGDAVDLRRLERLVERQRRADAGNAFRQHRFAAAGRPDHQHVVAAGDGDLDGALHVLLALHVGEVVLDRVEFAEDFVRIDAHRRMSDVPARNSAASRRCLTG